MVPNVELELQHGSDAVVLKNVLLDTGSASTILATNAVARIGLRPDIGDRIIEMYGIGRSESVVEKRVEQLALGGRLIGDFPVQLGEMDYGITSDRIVGADLLTALRGG